MFSLSLSDHRQRYTHCNHQCRMLLKPSPHQTPENRTIHAQLKYLGDPTLPHCHSANTNPTRFLSSNLVTSTKQLLNLS